MKILLVLLLIFTLSSCNDGRYEHEEDELLYVYKSGDYEVIYNLKIDSDEGMYFVYQKDHRLLGYEDCKYKYIESMNMLCIDLTPNNKDTFEYSFVVYDNNKLKLLWDESFIK